jgi:hypothetical protein
MKIFSILNDIEFKGNKANILLKWVIGIAGTAVVGAFVVGQLKMRHLNKLDDIEAIAIEGMKKTEQLERKVEEGFEEQNAKIDKIYEDGMAAFEEYRLFNNEQMKIIIDYGEENKDLVKRMLELNSQEKATQIENNLEQSKKESVDTNSQPENLEIGARRVIEPSEVVFTEVTTGINHYYVTNAPENYLDTLNLEIFKIVEKVESKKYKGLYDFKYMKK